MSEHRDTIEATSRPTDPVAMLTQRIGQARRRDLNGEVSITVFFRRGVQQGVQVKVTENHK